MTYAHKIDSAGEHDPDCWPCNKAIIEDLRAQLRVTDELFDASQKDVESLNAQLAAERTVRENVERQFGELTVEYLKLLDIGDAEHAARKKAEVQLIGVRRTLGVSVPTTERWAQGVSAPHPVILDGIDKQPGALASVTAERDALRQKLEAAERERDIATAKVEQRTGFCDGYHAMAKDALRVADENMNDASDARVERDAALARVATIRRETLEEAADYVRDEWDQWIQRSGLPDAIRALASTEGETE